MVWIFLAVVFYTVVKYGFSVWSQLQYDQQEGNEKFELQDKVGKLEEEVAELKKTDVDFG